MRSNKGIGVSDGPFNAFFSEIRVGENLPRVVVVDLVELSKYVLAMSGMVDHYPSSSEGSLEFLLALHRRADHWTFCSVLHRGEKHWGITGSFVRSCIEGRITRASLDPLFSPSSSGGSRLDSPFFCEEVLSPLVQKMQPNSKQARKPLTLIHKDNTRVQIARATQEKLDVSRSKHTPQPSYNPDIAPFNFFFSVD
jgi:hypothetical protein